MINQPMPFNDRLQIAHIVPECSCSVMPYWAIITPHQRTGVFYTKGNHSECYIHMEITIGIHQEGLLLACATVYNNQTWLKGQPFKYYPGKRIFQPHDPPEIHVLIEQLRQIVFGEVTDTEGSYTQFSFPFVSPIQSHIKQIL